MGLQDYRLVYVGPARGKTAVGDYAQNFVDAVRPLVGEVAEYRTDGPGEDSLADIRAGRRAVAELIAAGPPGRTLVHAELACGLMTPFWATAGIDDVPVSATVHDPPQGVWFMARTRFMASHRLLFHGTHYPMRPVARMIEGRVNGSRTLFALTETGRRSIESVYPRTDARYIPHLVAERPQIRPAHERPNAVGFFGHVYRGKGFEEIAQIRRLLPDDVAIRVAGRGTELLPASPGIDIVGPVDGPGEDAFFESVRAIVVPYGKRHFYADTFPASGVVAHSLAYQTPVICTAYGSLAELDAASGAVVVDTANAGQNGSTAAALAHTIAEVVNDPVRLTELGRNAEATRQARSPHRTAEAFVAAWSQMLARRAAGV